MGKDQNFTPASSWIPRQYEGGLDFLPEQSKCSKSGPNADPMTAILVLYIINISFKKKKKRSIPRCESM